MKKTLSILLLIATVMCMFCGCGGKEEASSEVAEETVVSEVVEEKHTIPTSVLDEAISNAKYVSSPFSISVGELVNSAVSNYKIKYLTGEEAIAEGHISEEELDSSINIDNLYYGIISGDSMVNPDVPYMTEYEEEAVKVWMVFDENDQLLNSGVTLCSNLQTCAILLMTSSY